MLITLQLYLQQTSNLPLLPGHVQPGLPTTSQIWCSPTEQLLPSLHCLLSCLIISLQRHAISLNGTPFLQIFMWLIPCHHSGFSMNDAYLGHLPWVMLPLPTKPAHQVHSITSPCFIFSMQFKMIWNYIMNIYAYLIVVCLPARMYFW